MNEELVFIAVTREEETQSMDDIRNDMVLASQLAELNQGSTENNFTRSQAIDDFMHQGVFVKVPSNGIKGLTKDLINFGFKGIRMRKTKKGLQPKLFGSLV